MKTILRLCLVCLPALVVSCGQESKGPPPEAVPSDAAPGSPRGPVAVSKAPAAVTTIPEGADPNVTLQRLTQALRDHVVSTRSVPKNFEDFAAKSQVRFPPAPAGKKYAIQGQEVVLVKN